MGPLTGASQVSKNFPVPPKASYLVLSVKDIEDREIWGRRCRQDPGQLGCITPNEFGLSNIAVTASGSSGTYCSGLWEVMLQGIQDLVPGSRLQDQLHHYLHGTGLRTPTLFQPVLVPPSRPSLGPRIPPL